MRINLLKPGMVLIMLAVTALSCKKNAEDKMADTTNLKTEKTALYENFSCEMLSLNTTGPVTEANGPSNKRWPNGSTVKVRFSGGSPYVRSKVTQYAKSWEAYANITFSFVADNAPADIKIAFVPPGSSSYIGTDARYQSTSMNFGWFNDNTSDTDFRRTTVHEFGHALGLGHEQSHPDSNIPWNRQAVYDYYMGPPNNWDKAKIDRNVLAVSPRNGYNYNAYDTKSIMHYPVQARFTTNNTVIAPNNTTISEGDIAYVRTYYPGRN
ncbi:M12 family metallopeptidase [Pedobacter miscanthi]|uniref:Peptidase M12 n=1 Tax=Pedobacter miscanthi TaxID=2259170 RepID=A0A366KQP8_9SPHI|nr:M12 family metallopeptidase [Pedobacter miscanthi]RBQ03112.1 peptidase M12 [Pedobacter miscanthi]